MAEVEVKSWLQLWVLARSAIAEGTYHILIATPDEQSIRYFASDCPTPDELINKLISDLDLSEEVQAEIRSGIPADSKSSKNPLVEDQVIDPARLADGPDVLDPGSKGQSL